MEEKNNTILKYGVYSSVMTIIVFAIMIVINLIVGQLNLKVDLTTDKLYSLSEQTDMIANQLQKDVKIYILYETGKEDITMQEVLGHYNEFSHVSTQVVDPYRNPQFVKKYASNGQELPMGTVIVESGDKFRVIVPEEMATYMTDPYTGMPQMETLNVESSITGAISYVASDENYKLYLLTGHGESPLDEGLLNQLKYSNFDVAQLDLVSAQKIPEDIDILMLNAPSKDISTNELSLIKDYLENSGRAVFNMGISFQPMPNLTELLDYYGVSVNQAVALEGSSNYVFQNNPYFILPSYGQHEITNPLIQQNENVMFPFSQGIQEVETKRSSLEITPLLITSNTSYGKKQMESVEDFEKAQGDLDGPFSLAVAIKDEWFTEQQNTTKLVVFGGKPLIDTQMNSAVNGGNFDFFLNCMNWLQDKEDTIAVRPKDIQTISYLNLNQTQAIIIMISCVIVLPIIIFGIGIFIMFRRKNR